MSGVLFSGTMMRAKYDSSKKYRRVFIEITNNCNLSCKFCAVSSRPRGFMPPEMFERIVRQVAPLASVVSLHVLGEPFTHPQLLEIVRICSRHNVCLNLVTNGTLISRFPLVLFEEKCFKQVSFSVHALACLPEPRQKEALAGMLEFAKTKPSGVSVSFRIRGSENGAFEKFAAETIMAAFPAKAEPNGRNGVKIAEGVFLNRGAIFSWPSHGAERIQKGCLGLRHHFAVLCSGEVVPCCADYDAKLCLGNVNDNPLSELLSSPAALALRDSIAGKTAMPQYCAGCGFCAP